MPNLEIGNMNIRIKADASGMKTAGKAIKKFQEDTQRRIEKMNRLKVSPVARMIDRLSGPAKKIESSLNRLSKKTVTVMVKAKDMTGGVIDKIMSPLTLLGAGAGVYGLGKVTLGAAMDFETQMVGMEHWLKGNKALANDFVGWLDTFAAKTPFEMGDLFPAGARAIGVSEGDIGMAKRLIGLSADMAGLTPGKTVQDAMEALADAQMGEFERMKEFNMKFTKEKMDAAGGFAGFMAQAEKKFSGGADKLSQTAKGRLSTITDFFKTQFRSAGQGMLEAMSPRLKKITDWFDNNANTVARWKDSLVRFGREGFEKLLSWGERAFNRIKKIIEDPGFKNADWGGKFNILLDEMINIVVPKATEAGLKIGISLGKGVANGILSAIQEDQTTAIIMGLYIGSKAPGGPWGKVATALGISSIPFDKRVIEQKKTDARMKGWDKAAESIYDKMGQTPDGEPILKGNFTMGVSKKEAFGDIITGPTHALIGEAGPELVLPLSQRMRSRALDLYQQAGRYLGVRPFADGGFAGLTPAIAGSHSSGGINVTVDGVTVNVNPNEIDEDALSYRIGKQIVNKVKKAIENRV